MYNSCYIVTIPFAWTHGLHYLPNKFISLVTHDLSNSSTGNIAATSGLPESNSSAPWRSSFQFPRPGIFKYAIASRRNIRRVSCQRAGKIFRMDWLKSLIRSRILGLGGFTQKSVKYSAEDIGMSLYGMSSAKIFSPMKTSFRGVSMMLLFPRRRLMNGMDGLV